MFLSINPRKSQRTDSPPQYVSSIFLFLWLLLIISPLSHSLTRLQCSHSLPALVSCSYSYLFCHLPLAGACPPSLCVSNFRRHLSPRATAAHPNCISPLPIRPLFSTATSSAHPLAHRPFPSFSVAEMASVHALSDDDRIDQSPESASDSVQSQLTIHSPPYTGLPMHMYPFAPGVVSASQPQIRSKRRQVKNACTNCQKACKKCDDARPCLRCVKYGIGEECVDSQRKERKKGIKRGPYKKRDGKSEPFLTLLLLINTCDLTLSFQLVALRRPPRTNLTLRPLQPWACHSPGSPRPGVHRPPRLSWALWVTRL